MYIYTYRRMHVCTYIYIYIYMCIYTHSSFLIHHSAFTIRHSVLVIHHSAFMYVCMHAKKHTGLFMSYFDFESILDRFWDPKWSPNDVQNRFWVGFGIQNDLQNWFWIGFGIQNEAKSGTWIDFGSVLESKMRPKRLQTRSKIEKVRPSNFRYRWHATFCLLGKILLRFGGPFRHQKWAFCKGHPSKIMKSEVL